MARNPTVVDFGALSTPYNNRAVGATLRQAALSPLGGPPLL